MTKMDLAIYLLRLDKHALSKTESLLLETKLIISIFNELLEIFRNQYKDYLNLIKYCQEGSMFCMSLAQEMIKDILSTEEYSLQGIAIHTNIPEEVLLEIASGINKNPTFDSSKKLFELHIMVRRNLYDNIIEKIMADYLAQRGKYIASKN
jgi:hypothetical protein